MAQSSQKNPLGSFTITVGREDTNLQSQMTVRHILKPKAMEKSPEAILVTDLDIAQFVTYLMIDIEYDMVLDRIEYWLPGTDIAEVLALEDRTFQAVITKMYNRLWRTGQSEINFTVRTRTYQKESLPGIRAPTAPNYLITEPYNEAQLAEKNTSPDEDLSLKQNTLDSPCTLDVEQQKLISDDSLLRNVNGWKWALVVSAILSSLFLYALDNTIVANIQPTIVETFGDVGELSWLGVAFRLGTASTNLIWAKIYGRFNAKWTYILSLFLFEAGSTVCGAANNLSIFIVGRAICGVGGVGLYIGVLNLLSMTTSIRERPNYLASTGMVFGLGTVLGPVVGGLFAESAATWRWAFYINLCLGALFAPVYLILLPSIDPQPGMPLSNRIRELDIMGAMLLIGAFSSGIMAITFGGTLYPWTSAQILGCFLTSGNLFIIFGFQQAYAFLTTKEQRIFPVEFLKSSVMVLLFCSMSCASTSLLIPIYMVPLFFQFTRSDTALGAAVRLLPFIFIAVFATIANGALMSKYGHYMPWYLAAGIFTTIGATMMSIIHEETSASQIYGSTLLLGFGVGLVLQASFSVAQATVPAAKTSDAVGFITCAQVSSSTISLAISNSIFLNGAQNLIRAFLPDVPLSTIQDAIAGVGSSFVASLSDEMRKLVIHSIVQSIGKVYILGIVAGVFLILLSLGLRKERLF